MTPGVSGVAISWGRRLHQAASLLAASLARDTQVWLKSRVWGYGSGQGLPLVCLKVLSVAAWHGFFIAEACLDR